MIKKSSVRYFISKNIFKFDSNPTSKKQMFFTIFFTILLFNLFFNSQAVKALSSAEVNAIKKSITYSQQVMNIGCFYSDILYLPLSENQKTTFKQVDSDEGDIVKNTHFDNEYYICCYLSEPITFFTKSETITEQGQRHQTRMFELNHFDLNRMCRLHTTVSLH